MYTFLVIHCYITVNLYLTCPCSSCWRIHILYIFLIIHCYNNSQFVSYLPLLVLLEDTYYVYLPGHPLLYNSQFVSYLPCSSVGGYIFCIPSWSSIVIIQSICILPALARLVGDTYSVYLPGHPLL